MVEPIVFVYFTILTRLYIPVLGTKNNNVVLFLDPANLLHGHGRFYGPATPAPARAPDQFFYNFLCKSRWIFYINPYKLGNFFILFYYFLAISYLNPYKCVAIFFCPDFTLILAPPLFMVAWTPRLSGREIRR